MSTKPVETTARQAGPAVERAAWRRPTVRRIDARDAKKGRARVDAAHLS